MEQDYEKQFAIIRFAAAAQTVLGFLISGALCYDLMIAPLLPSAEPADSTTVAVLWAVAGFLALIYVLIQYGVNRIDERKKMPLLKFWCRELHRGRSSSALAIMLVLSSHGEATVILGFVMYFLGARDPVVFLPGLLLGLAELIFAFPRESIKEKLILLDKLADP